MVAHEGQRPFVLLAEVVQMTMEGISVFGVPVGVELADTPRHAFQQAIRRWPYHNLLMPEPWGAVPPKVRLAALEADRKT